MNILIVMCCCLGCVIIATVPVVVSYTVEANFYVEPSVTRNSRQLQNDISIAASILRQMSGVDIQLVIKDIVFLESNVLSQGWFSGTIDAFEAVASFWKKIRVNGGNKAALTMLLTGQKLGSQKNPSARGAAYEGTVCGPQGVGVLGPADQSHFNPVLLAHEMTHILGAKHDGDPRVGCNEKSGHVMNPTVIYLPYGSYRFSSCTTEQVKRTIQSLSNNGNNCLLRGFNGGWWNQ